MDSDCEIDEELQLIEDHKKKIEKLSKDVEINLLRDNIHFSAYQIKNSSYAELVRVISELPVGGIIIYAKNEHQLSIIQENLLKADIKIKALVTKDTEEKRTILQDFNLMRYKRIISIDPVKTERENIRAIIHHGLPKSIDKVYRESLQLGKDGKPSKSIVFWRDEEVVQLVNRLERNNHDEECKISNYCMSLLDKMYIYCSTKVCRRSIIRRYFSGCNLEMENSTPAADTKCCDNCEKVIYDSLTPSLIYKNITESNTIDISDETRLILNVINDFNCGLYECKCVLQGRLFSFDLPHRLDSFGGGQNKPEEYWALIFQELHHKGYIKSRKISRLGHKFLRYKTRKIEMKAFGKIKDYLEKKAVHIARKNGEINITPKEKVIYEDLSDEIKKDLNFQYQKANNQDMEKLFDFTVLSNPVLKKVTKKIEDTKYVEGKIPKVDWQEDRATVISRKDNLKKIEEKQLRSSNHDFVQNENVVQILAPSLSQPGCSHWSTTVKNASNLSNQEEEEKEVDEKYEENMRQIRQQFHNPLSVPLDDLLDFIEAYISDVKNTKT